MIANRISGWYYDLQLENRLTSASLHPYCEKGQDGKWKPFEGESDPDIKQYRKDPICRAIITEDFNVSIANTWSDFGGDMLGQMWESMKPLAPYVGAAKEMIHSAVEDYNSADSETLSRIKESKVSSTMAKLMIALDKEFQKPDGVGVKVEDYLNRALVVQGTRFSYYSGSGTSFGNLMMKFTLFPTYDGSTYITVDKQVEKILPYCIGEYVAGSDGLEMEDKEAQNIIDGMIGWQKPPGGFKANVKNVDVIQEGTLMLRFGAYYAITNLVVESVNFNFSKQMTKMPDPTLEKNELISPLFCDVTLQLRPATKYSDKSLRNFVLSRSSTATIKEVTQDLKDKLINPTLGNSNNGTFYVY